MFVFFVYLLICAFVTEAIVELVSKSVFFGPVREFLSKRKNFILRFYSNAIKCPYCFSVHASLLVSSPLFILVPPSLTNIILLDFILFSLSCHRLSNYIHDTKDRYFDKSYK